jgi:S-DNA-T family DNA segregation ATPase FtsK/SpoIIIE
LSNDSSTLHVLVNRRGSAEELCISFTHHHRISDLTRALVEFLDEPAEQRLAAADGQLLEPELLISDSSICHGDQLLLVDSHSNARRTPATALELRVLAGAAAGLRLPLPRGTLSLGRAPGVDLPIPDRSVSRSPAWLHIDDRVLVQQVEARQEIRIDGRAVAPGMPLPEGQPFEMGRAMMVVARTPVERRPSGYAGAIAFQSQPRSIPAYQPPYLSLPPTPAQPRKREQASQYQRLLQTELQQQLPRLLAQEAAERHWRAPDASDLAERARLGTPALWERGRADPDFLRLRLGRSNLASDMQIQLPPEADRELIGEALGAELPAAPSLVGVPLTVDLARHGILAVSGGSAETAGLTRWLVIQAACLHRPSDLGIIGVLADGEPWSWLSWLPHTAPWGIASARRLVAAGRHSQRLAREVSAIIEERRRAGPADSSRPLLILVEEGASGSDILLDELKGAAGWGVYALHVGATAPAVARAVVQMVPGRNAALLSSPEDATQQSAIPDQLVPEVAGRIARDLAGIVEVSHGQQTAAATIGLIDALGALDGQASLPELLVARWEDDAGGLNAVVGVSNGEPVEVDLRVGPNAIVRGSSDAGRGELLSAWVAGLAFRHSPRWLNLLVVDVGGSPSLDRLRGLPHAVALPPSGLEDVIPDLIGALTREAEWRRQLLHQYRAKTMTDLLPDRPEKAPAQVVVVLDGYDRLVSRRPETEPRIAELTERCQGLGIHLILGTSSPVGLFLPSIRRAAGLLVDLDPPAPGSLQPSATLLVADRASTAFGVAGVDHIPAGDGRSIRVQRLEFASGGEREITAVTANGGSRSADVTDLAALVQAASQAAGTLELPLDRLVWRPALRLTRDQAAEAAGRAPGKEGPRARAELRLTLESPNQSARDVAVEIDPQQSVRELVKALTGWLGIETAGDTVAYHPRRHVSLRPDQTLRSAGLRIGDRLVIGPQDAPAMRAVALAGSDASTEGRAVVGGRVLFNRPPRALAEAPELRIELGSPPERGQGSWRALIPVGTAVFMGLAIGGSTFLLSGTGQGAALLLVSAGMTPIMALLTGIMPVRDALTRRRTFERAAREFKERIKTLPVEIESLQAIESSYLRESAPDVEALIERARTLDQTLWDRRPGNPDWLGLRVGVMTAASSVTVSLAAGGEKGLRELAQHEIGQRPPLPAIPMVLPLAEIGALGVSGERSGVNSLARWLVVQLATLHSPEQVIVVAAIPARDRQEWAWLSWLPHVHSPAARLPNSRLVSDGVAARGLLQRLLALLDERSRAADSRVDGRVAIVALLHEDAELPRAQVSRLLAMGPQCGIYTVWIGSRRSDLPGECRAEAGVHTSDTVTSVELKRLAPSLTSESGTADGISVDDALEVARSIAPVRDISAGGAQSAVPQHVGLLELLGMQNDVETGLLDRWGRREPPGERQVDALIGARAGGAGVSLDLRVDGPHVLVEGPAGSGKSEFLRSLVASMVCGHPPSSVTFLLVDHDGQGTFKECAALPHTASVASRLDNSGAKRILSALRAELNVREGILREADAKDLATLERSQRDLAPPSLVIVLDEFARLATELPEFVDGLMTLGAQGSRLGVHLVLATRQLPRESRQIWESINLRIELRGARETDAESQVPARPDLPPGRAFVRVGAEPPAELQVAFTSGHTAREETSRAILVRELDFDGTPAPARAGAAAELTGREIDLSRIVRGVQALAGRFDLPPSPRVLSELSSDSATAVATSVPLAELLGIADLGALDVDALWQPRPLPERLRVPTGLTGSGQPMLMDLKEAAAGGAGPHGLLIGTSGSGKSEMLRTLVTALAITHSPEVLSFVFIDFKGGAAFAGLSELPHVAGMITNLQDDLSLIDRMQAAITGERNRRQQLLRRAGNVDKVSEYQRKREMGEPLEPLPYLLLIVDEFGELLTARPDFVNLFAMVGRVGRSLGIHLLFSSQQFEEGRLRGLEDNIGYRIALRTASPVASRTVLGVPDAFDLPKEPGWGYFKAGPADIVRFRAGLVSQPYGAPVEEGKDPPTTLDVAVAQLVDRAEPVHQIWLPPLQLGITLDDSRILGKAAPVAGRGLTATSGVATGQLRAPIGLVDKPAEQKQDVMAVDLTGHLLVIGATQTGKSTLLRTLLASTALTHTPLEAQFYCIDYSGGALRSAAGLPHVGGICGRGDPERVRRTVEEVMDLIARREVLFQRLGIDSPQVMRARRAAGELPSEMADVFLVVDNWMGLRQELGELEDQIRDVIAARGPGYGVHLVLTANRMLEVRDALRNAFGTRLELRLNEPAESLIDTRAARSLSEAGQQFEQRMEELRQLNRISPRFDKLYGRGITTGGLQFQTALPRMDGRGDVLNAQQAFEELIQAVDAAWKGPKAPPIRVLPPSIRVAELPRPNPEPDGVPIGISEQDLGPVYLDLAGADPHFIVFGDVESGKSTLLRTFVSGLLARSTPEEVQILLVDYRRSLLGLVPAQYLLGHCSSEPIAKENLGSLAAALGRRLPGSDVAVDQLRSRSWWKSQAEVYIVVDDYDLVASSSGSPLQPLYPLLPQSRDLAFHLVIARSSGGALQGIGEPVLRRLRELRSPGLLMSGEPQEGVILGGHRLTPLPPGRGRLIMRREAATFIQVATV